LTTATRPQCDVSGMLELPKEVWVDGGGGLWECGGMNELDPCSRTRQQGQLRCLQLILTREHCFTSKAHQQHLVVLNIMNVNGSEPKRGSVTASYSGGSTRSRGELVDQNL
jgi:hypothetical protein